MSNLFIHIQMSQAQLLSILFEGGIWGYLPSFSKNQFSRGKKQGEYFQI